MASSSTTTTTTTMTTTTTATSNMVNNSPALPRARFNWIFPLEKISATPSMKNNMSADEELSQRQQAAVFIHELGNHLKVPHYCVNTAVVYMHRFYMINSFQATNRHRVCAAALFLACKVEEVPRPLRDVIENTGKVLRKKNSEDLTKELIAKFAEEIVYHENILLSTLGFSLMVDHPHAIIIKTIQTLGSQIQSLPEKTPRELAQTAYYLATKSILFTPFCVKYPPDLIACFCIHLAAAWLKIEMPSPSSNTNSETTEANNQRWFHLVNQSFTEKQLGDLADEFLAIYEKCPDRIKRKLAYQSERPQSTNAQDGASSSSSSSSTTTIGSSHPPTTSRPTELADSVVPQGASREKQEHRQSHPMPTNPPPIPANRPPLPSHSAPPLPPPPSSGAIKREPQPPLPSSGSIKREPGHPSGAVKRESTTPSAPPPPNPSFSSNSRSSHPPPMGQSRSSSHYPHPPSHYPPTQPPPPQQSSHHHMNNNYNPHSRFPSQQAPPRPPLPPPPQQQHNMDRKGPPPPPAPSSNRPPYNNPPRNSHYNNVPPPSNPYPNQGLYGGHQHPPSLMNVGGEKRSYDGNYDPNNKRPRPGPPSSSSSSSQQWNNK